jgi:hypothetical protein
LQNWFLDTGSHPGISGDHDRALTLHAAAETTAPDVSRAGFLAGRHSVRSDLAMLAGRLPEAYDEARAAVQLQPNRETLIRVMRIAIWLNDVERAGEHLGPLTTGPERGRYIGPRAGRWGPGWPLSVARDATTAYRSAAAASARLGVLLDRLCLLE